MLSYIILIEMDTILLPHTTSATRPRYFTVMSGLPADLNREQALSLLSSVSQVLSLNILRVHREGLPVNRIGLVEVEDNESVYRLTSRQFLVRHNQAVKHKMIQPSARLVQHLANKDITLKLKFFSTERGSSRLVTDFFERFGELCVISMKAHAGHHEMTFKVSRDYSIRHLTTDMLVRVGGIVVEIEYQEDDLNFDYYEQDLDLLLEIQSSLEFSKTTAPEQSNYFYPSVPGPALSVNEPISMWLVDKEYFVDDDEDDFLSVLNEDLEEDSISNAQSPFSVNSVILNHNCDSGATYGIEFFNTSRNRLTLTRLSANIISPVTFEIPQSDNKKPKAKRQSLKVNIYEPQEELPTQDRDPDILPDLANTTDCNGKRSKKRRHKKAIGSSASKDIAQTTSLVVEVNSESSAVEPHISSTNDDDSANALSPSLTDTQSNGSNLLQLIWPNCHDFDLLNERTMPEIHSKWRRFVEIKDEMRKERYSEYLRQRAQETTTLFSTVQQASTNEL